MHTDTIPSPPPTTEIITETVMVTPDMAKTWLEKNLANRPLIQRMLSRMASASSRRRLKRHRSRFSGSTAASL